MPTPMTALSGLSGVLSITNSIIDLTSTEQRFAGLAATMQKVGAQVVEKVVKEIYQSELREIDSWIAAYSSGMRRHIVDVQSGLWTPTQLFERFVLGKTDYFTQADGFTNQLAALVRDEDSGVDIASEALLMYLTLQTFLIGMHKEIIRVAKLAVDSSTATAEAAVQPKYTALLASEAKSTATELMRIITARRRSMVAPRTDEPLGSSGRYLFFCVLDTYLSPGLEHVVLVMTVPSKDDRGYIGRVTDAYQNAMVGWSSMDRESTPDACVARLIAATAGQMPRSASNPGQTGGYYLDDPDLTRGFRIAERVRESAQWYTDARGVIMDFARIEADGRPLAPRHLHIVN